MVVDLAEGDARTMATVAEQLQQLAALRKEGVLSEEEFEEQKQILLAESRARTSTTPSDPTMLAEVGAYRLLGLIGEGGMGAVYRGRHRSETMADRQGGDVAVKVMHPQYARNPDYRDRFEREAALGMKLDHRGIVKVHDLVVDGGNLALVMDYVEGRSLNDQIGEVVGPIPWDRAWPLFQKLLAAVGYAHDQGVVHRDIKPENILVTPEGVPRVIDFGIAKDVDGSGTRTGTGMGTVEYMAPEQYTDAKAVDRRADIYSLGMILYETLAGRLPWDADAPQFRILEQKANKELMSPSAFCPDIPPEIVAALSPSLAAEPGARPVTTRAFTDALVAAAANAARRLRAEAEQRRQAEEERRRVEAEQRRQAEEVERQAREAAERRVQHPASPVRRTSAKSEGLDDRKKQKERRRLPLAGVVLAGLLLVVGGLLVVGVKNANSPALVLEMVSIEPGEFWMGSPSDEEGRMDNEKLHKVRLTRAFQIGVTEVTQEMYEAVNGENPSSFKFFSKGRNPVERVSWFDAVAFCIALSELEGLTPAYRISEDTVTWNRDSDGYRLPTAAEWEYAARGGEGYAYSGSIDLGAVGWYAANSGNKTHEVGGKQANSHGLHDMSGNVWEWVWDRYGGYPTSVMTDPAGSSVGSYKVVRGGSWKSNPGYARVAVFNASVPGDRHSDLGFRLARSLP